MKELYTKNYKMLLKKIIQDTNKWKDMTLHWSKDVLLLQCSYYPKKSTESMQSLSQF